jgi:hypothetical protein
MAAAFRGSCNGGCVARNHQSFSVTHWLIFAVPTTDAWLLALAFVSHGSVVAYIHVGRLAFGAWWLLYRTAPNTVASWGHADTAP